MATQPSPRLSTQMGNPVSNPPPETMNSATAAMETAEEDLKERPIEEFLPEALLH